MARFASTQASEGKAIGVIADLANFLGQRTYTAITSGSSSTATAAAFVNGIYNFSGGSTYTLTTPTAAQIVAQIPNCQVGSCASVHIINTNSGTTTVTAGSGVTGVGTLNVTTNKAQGYEIIVTNATAGSEAVQLIGNTYAGA